MKLTKAPRLRAVLIATSIAALTAFAQPALAQDAPSAATAPKPPSYAALTAATAPVADAYFAAYIANDWDALEPLLAEAATFQDPTASHIFGGVLSDGRTAMMERFRTGYASLTHMEFTKNRSLISDESALYEGALHWGIDLGDGTLVDCVTPMVIVLTVVDGKVTRHLDYVDYAPFVAAMRKARAAAQ
ncbi:nuclear transport factor 2 family protein [Parasphingorhabdus sp.]|jgi:ketosteroid isomerase-like protein|uniref:nuclear transport factor 2 family protein n=1 Tax=Parasphingorhabdus sp. TaxID=2709688 RepID=UPI0039E4418F